MSYPESSPYDLAYFAENPQRTEPAVYRPIDDDTLFLRADSIGFPARALSRSLNSFRRAGIYLCTTTEEIDSRREYAASMPVFMYDPRSSAMITIPKIPGGETGNPGHIRSRGFTPTDERRLSRSIYDVKQSAHLELGSLAVFIDTENFNALGGVGKDTYDFFKLILREHDVITHPAE